MSSSLRQPLPATLWARTGALADAAQVADATAGLVHEIAACLRPVVGKLGVEALYRRSVFLASQNHPWMATALETLYPGMDLVALRLALAAQSVAAAAAGGEALLLAFDHVLVSLVGAALAERMLQPVSSSPAASLDGSPGRSPDGSPQQKGTSPWPRK